MEYCSSCTIFPVKIWNSYIYIGENSFGTDIQVHLILVETKQMKTALYSMAIQYKLNCLL